MTRLDGRAKRGDEIKCYVFVTNVNKVVGEIKIDKRDRSNSKNEDVGLQSFEA